MKLTDLFLNVRHVCGDGWVTLSDGENYRYNVTNLFGRFGERLNQRGIFVVVHRYTGMCYVGTAIDTASVVSSLRNTLKAGKHSNVEMQKLYDKGQEQDFVVIAIYCNCVKMIYETSQWLMNDFRTKGVALNTFFKTKAHGVAELKEDESVYGCYRLTHRPSGYFYVGSAKNPIGRKYVHLHKLRNKEHRNSTLQSLWDRTEEKDWEWGFTIFGNKEAAYDHEQAIIDEHFGKSGTLLLNHSNNARDPINGLMTPDVRRKSIAGSTAATRAIFSQAVVVDGKEYPSATAAGEALGVSQSTVSRWANNPANPKAYWKDGSRPEFVEGKVRKVNMWRDPESRKARTGSGNPFAKKIVVDNVTYGSVKEAQDAVKVGEKTLRKWANDSTNYRVYWG